MIFACLFLRRVKRGILYEKGGATLNMFPLLCIEIKPNKYFVFILSLYCLLNYMCMENLETFATLDVSFLSSQKLTVFLLLFPHHRKITNAILTTFWCLIFVIRFTTTQGQGAIFHREAFPLKEAELVCLEHFALQQSRFGI